MARIATWNTGPDTDARIQAAVADSVSARVYANVQGGSMNYLVVYDAADRARQYVCVAKD